MNKLSCINIDISLCFFSPINDSSTVRKHKNQERVKKQPSPSPAPEVSFEHDWQQTRGIYEPRF